MSTIAALVLSASALSGQAYAAETAPVAAQATSTVKTIKPAAKTNMASVPEPVSYKLMLLGIAVLLLFARTGKKREQPWTK
ncbi:PEP-CTERM sorting domain-containing protein [Duganella sp. S19_KUP01_CR8]|uniref:PEP-CTERM sorting domain-containing protein n=1 Tax=Duganella sp. S19_KUP01_CR8 TaxID=3025502 RepID=UPI002FCD870C